MKKITILYHDVPSRFEVKMPCLTLHGTILNSKYFAAHYVRLF